MEVMVVNGKRYLINTDLADHVLDGVCRDILKWYPSDANVEFDDVKPSDIRP